jgi:hypothetical protein
MFGSELATGMVRRSAALLFVSAALACSTPSSPGPAITSVVITPSHATLVVGDSLQLEATALDSNGVVIPGARFTWGPIPCEMCAPPPILVSPTGNVRALYHDPQLPPDTITAQVYNGVFGKSAIADTDSSIAASRR